VSFGDFFFTQFSANAVLVLDVSPMTVSEVALTFNQNGRLHYPNEIDRSLNEAADDNIRKYRPDYNNLSCHVRPDVILTSADVRPQVI
jgi:hypothetical protein